MTPQSPPRKPRNSSRTSLVIALVFHAVLVFIVLYFAAQSGLIGERLKKLTVSIVKETPPEKPKEPDKPVPPPEPPKEAQPKMVEVAPTLPPPSAPPVEMPTTLAPPPADLPSFAFDDGAKPVETATPAGLYKNLVEYTLRANWDRPTDTADSNYSAEIEIAVDSSGRITGEKWERGSGDPRWDNSVSEAIAHTQKLNRPPPAGFPGKVLVRFDTVPELERVFQ